MPFQTRSAFSPQSSGYGYSGQSLTRDQTRGVFGQVMGLVAVTFGFLALGAYLGRNINGGGSFIFFIAAIAALFGLQFAVARGREQLAIGLLFGVGLLLGLFVSPIIVYYANSDPGAVYQAAGATAGFTALLGSFGYATRTDLSRYYRAFFFALIALIVFGLVLMFVAIPGGNVIYSVLGLIIFGGLTAFDFQRLRSAGMTAAPVIAASIFLDIFNIFLFFLSLFGGGGRR
ncbi:MAG TPA: Bax inhibitor-1 family protein [Solirubrobacteraceae bacterium]|nr:Bax inhibitor-1 family protein [Solirubrobacteraceae bacterium]